MRGTRRAISSEVKIARFILATGSQLSMNCLIWPFIFLFDNGQSLHIEVGSLVFCDSRFRCRLRWTGRYDGMVWVHAHYLSVDNRYV